MAYTNTGTVADKQHGDTRFRINDIEQEAGKEIIFVNRTTDRTLSIYLSAGLVMDNSGACSTSEVRKLGIAPLGGSWTVRLCSNLADGEYRYRGVITKPSSGAVEDLFTEGEEAPPVIIVRPPGLCLDYVRQGLEARGGEKACRRIAERILAGGPFNDRDWDEEQVERCIADLLRAGGASPDEVRRCTKRLLKRLKA